MIRRLDGRSLFKLFPEIFGLSFASFVSSKVEGEVDGMNTLSSGMRQAQLVDGMVWVFAASISLRHRLCIRRTVWGRQQIWTMFSAILT